MIIYGIKQNLNTKPKGAVQTTTTEVKARLKAVRETERQYRLAKDKYAAYMQLLTGGKGIRYESSGTVHERDSNPVEKAYCQLADYETDKDRLLGELVTARQQADKYINLLTDPSEKEVVTRRYLMFQKWDDIAKDMNYSRQHVIRLHGYALKKMCLNVTFSL